MSKLMSKLNSLNESRKVDGDVIVEDARDNTEQVQVIRDHKGIYFLSFLMVLLIGFSVFSLSISLKTFAQLEETWADSKTILVTLRDQQNEISSLQQLVADSTSTELSLIDEVSGQINELKLTLKKREEEIAEIKVAYSDIKASLKESIEELKLSDQMMLDKHLLLDDQLQKFKAENYLNLSTY